MGIIAIATPVYFLVSRLHYITTRNPSKASYVHLGLSMGPHNFVRTEVPIRVFLELLLNYPDLFFLCDCN